MATFRFIAKYPMASWPIVAAAMLLSGQPGLANDTGTLPATGKGENNIRANPLPNNPEAAFAPAGASASVTFGRAASLVGTPLYLKPEPQSGFRLTGSLPSGLPVAARSLTSDFGMRPHPLLGGFRPHQGIDLAASAGSPIVATSDGLVSWSGWRGGYGLFVALNHGNGVQTRYGHMSRINVVSGQQVRKGDTIGYVGSTGLSTGPHLHYEMRINGQAVNPRSHLMK